MTATKNNSIFKKLGALAMAMCLTCALAVSASALDAGTQYTPSLSVDAAVPHTLNIFDGNATVNTITETDPDTFEEVEIDVITIDLLNPAEIVVTPFEGGPSFTATGTISSAVATEETVAAGYTVDLSEDGSALTVTCPHEFTTATFAPVITFQVNTSATSHRAVDATLHLTAVE